MLLKSGIIIVIFTILSRILGLARELFIAATFGSNFAADCVNVAFKFPNLFRKIFGEGALSIAFVHVFSKKLVDSKELACKFSGKVLTLLFLVLTLLSLIIQVMMPYLIIIIVPGFCKVPDKYRLVILLCRITTPYFIFISLTTVFGSMLNSIKNFAPFAFVPAIMNICVIVFTYLTKERIDSTLAVSYSLILAGTLQVAFMCFYTLKARLFFPLSFNFFYDSDITKLLKNMGAISISYFIQQVSFLISQAVASFIPGALSILSYAERIYHLPLSIIGTTFSTILLPELSKLYQRKDILKANTLQNKAIVISLVLSVPSTILLFVLANPIIFFIYERGIFLSADTAKTANTLSAFSLGLPAFVLIKILMLVFYSNGDSKTPIRININCLFINTFLNISLIVSFNYIGIAIGSSIAAWYNLLLVNKYIKNYSTFKLFTETKSYIYRILISALVMTVVLFTFCYYCNNLYYSNCLVIRALILFLTVLISTIVYISMLFFFKVHFVFRLEEKKYTKEVTR